MRLEDFVNEDMKAISRVKKVIEKTIVPLGRFLERNNFKVTPNKLISTLNKIFKNDGIEFNFVDKPKDGLFSFIRGMAIFIQRDELNVEVDMYKETVDYLSTLNKNTFYSVRTNQFLMNLVEGLIHEFTHWEQKMKSGGKDIRDTSSFDAFDYFEDKSEIDAHALQSAVHFMRYGKPNYMFKNYVQYSQPELGGVHIFKRFMKRYLKYKRQLEKSEVFRSLMV